MDSINAHIRFGFVLVWNNLNKKYLQEGAYLYLTIYGQQARLLSEGNGEIAGKSRDIGVSQLSESNSPWDIGLHSAGNIQSCSAHKIRGFSRTSEVTYKKQTCIYPGFGGVHKRFSEIRAINQLTSGTFACVEKILFCRR